MAISPLKRPYDEDEETSYHAESSTRSPDQVDLVKRVKREHGESAADFNPPISNGINGTNGVHNGSSSFDGPAERSDEPMEGDGEEGEQSESETDSEDEEMDREALEFRDDAANVQAYEAVKARQGTVLGYSSDAGTIKHIVLVDFMCHRHFSMDLGNKMNFLVGHNGSGKSAILTAISVALGGKALSTGRGGGLKDLIRKEADKAIITLVMANDGPEAFKPEVYGDQIVIERSIDRSGSSSYKFRATRDGRILANKKDEMTQICQNYNINIDSPLTVLTQDNARTFLQNATDSILYKFFLDSTQLATLAKSYEKTMGEIAQMKHVVDQQEEALPDRQAEMETLQRRVQSSERLLQLRSQIGALDRQLPWAMVRDQEQRIAFRESELEEKQARFEAAEQEVRNCQRELEPMQLELTKAEADLEDFQKSKAPIEQAEKRAKGKMQRAKELHENLLSTIQEMEFGLSESRQDLWDLEKQIEQKQAAAEDAEDPKQRELRQSISSHQQLLRKLEKQEPVNEQKHADIGKELEKLEREEGDLQYAFQDAAAAVNAAKENVVNLQRQASNRVSAFGTRIEGLLDEIRRTRWPSGSMPIGPLGMYVKLEDFTYKQAFQSVMGNHLCGFAVQTPADKDVLLKMMSRHINQGYRANNGSRPAPPIITWKKDHFDLTGKDKSHLHPTMLSKLEISDEVVLQVLVNQFRIESVFVTIDDQIADKTLKAMLDGGERMAEFVTANNYRQQGAAAARGLNETSGNQPIEYWRGSQLFTKDLNLEIQKAQENVTAAENNKKATQERLKAHIEIRKDKEAEKAQAKREWDQVLKGIREVPNRINALQDQIEDTPDAVISGLESSKREIQDRIDSLEDQLKPSQDDLPQAEETYRKLKEEFEDLERQRESFAPDIASKQKYIHDIVELRASKQKDLKHWKGSRDKKETEMREVQEILENLKNELPGQIEKARRIQSERPEIHESTDHIKKQKETLSKRLKEGENREGVSVDDLMPMYNAAVKKYKDLKEKTEGLRKFISSLSVQIRKRRRWWEKMRAFTSVRTRTLFMINLHKRNLEGRLIFDHQTEKLAVSVTTAGQPRQQAETQEGASQYQFKIPKNLSGGERSFSTVCLLLSLWDTASCPIRCLDEWDVFLDAGNRKIAAGLLIEGAKQSEGKQFILITPQDVSGIRIDGVENRMIRMKDPIRNQGTLPFVPAAPAA